MVRSFSPLDPTDIQLENVATGLGIRWEVLLYLNSLSWWLHYIWHLFKALTPPVVLFPKSTWQNDLFRRTSQGFYFTFCYYLALSIYQVRCWVRILFDNERIVRILLGNAKARDKIRLMCVKFSKILRRTGKSSHWLQASNFHQSLFECSSTHPSWKLNQYKSVKDLSQEGPVFITGWCRSNFGSSPPPPPPPWEEQVTEKNAGSRKSCSITYCFILSQALHPLVEASLPRKANLTGFCKRHMSQSRGYGRIQDKRSREGQKKIVEQSSSLYRRRNRERVGFRFVACQSGAREAKVRGV